MLNEDSSPHLFALSLISLAPVNYFAFEMDCHSVEQPGLQKLGKHYMLPSTADWCDEAPFASVFLGWCSEGIAVEVEVNQPLEESFFPDVERGDSVELFFDTRDRKIAGFNTRFCHHFCFLPYEVEGVQAAEITRFRTEDVHDLCDPTLLQVQTTSKRTGYRMQIFIPSECLYGFDTEQFDRLGFTYRINRLGDQPQHFSLVTHEYAIDQHPSLWATLKLV